MQNGAKGLFLVRNLNKSVRFLLYSLSTKMFLTMKTPPITITCPYRNITVTQKPQSLCIRIAVLSGGEGEIWTLAPVKIRPTPLAGAPLRPTWVLLRIENIWLRIRNSRTAVLYTIPQTFRFVNRKTKNFSNNFDFSIRPIHEKNEAFASQIWYIA